MSASSPPTPPSSVPDDREQWRFETITSPCEWIESYHPGGYHPVHLGDTFNNGQYKVIRKLGEGAYSTVWLARDQSHERYVALKITVSGKSETANELQILHHLAKIEPNRTHDHITRLLDEFVHCGPNSLHKCLVFEPMGPSVNVMVEELPQFKPRTWFMKIRYPVWMAKSILKQALQALEHLYANGIAHGDFQPGNMLFDLGDINSISEDVLVQHEDEESRSISPPVKRRDGKQDKWAPRYLCVAQPLAGFTHHGEGFKIKLTDMGGAYFFTDPPAKFITPTGLRAPEMILSQTVNKTLDIWSFGCLTFELITGRPLFCIPWSGGNEDDKHLLSLHDILGPLPENIFNQWKTSSLYFTKDRKLFNCGLGGVKEGAEPLMLETHSMEELFDRAKPELEEEEASQIKALIRRILQYDPAKRPSPKELLDDPWFVDI